MAKTKLQDEEWEHVSGSGIWSEYKNKKTGESTIRSFQMQKSSRYDECDHYWVLTDPHDTTIQCRICGLGSKIVWGIHLLRNGKVIENN